MTLTANQKEKATVIQSIGNLKIQPALEYLEGYLDDSGLQQTAARAIMKIALPGTDGTRGLSGERARNILERIIPLLKGDESDYDKINIKNYLEQIPQIYQLTESEKKEGFVSLFSGINLDGWQGDTIGYFVETGMIVISPDREGNGIGRLYTAKVFSDFVFRFDFQLTPGANNGLGIRTPLEGTAAYAAMEIQILDDSAPVYSNLKEYQYHGSVYGVIPAKRGYLKPVGEWNSQEVIAKGTRIKVILNGHTILDGDIAEASKNGTIDHRDHPGLLREKGHIGFLGHGTIVRFRNIRIKEINLGNDDKDS